MALFTDSTKKPINPGDSYVAADGTQYPSSFPKEEIPGLTQVIETQPPVDDSVVVTGFYIDAANYQVWQTRPKTEEELRDALVSSLQNQIIQLESSVTDRRIREALSTDEVIAAAGKAWISNVETQIASLRADLAAALA